MIGSIGSSANDMATRMWNRLIKNDSDGDGKMSKAEMQTAFANMPAAPGGAPSFDEIFSQTDTDGDGMISQDEFSTYQKTRKPPGPQDGGGTSISDMQEKIWQSILSQADKDGDSAISKSELESALSSTSSSSETASKADDLFARIDTDQDGKMSEAEFSTFMEAHKPSGGEAPPPPPPAAESGTTDDPLSSGTSLSGLQQKLWEAMLAQTDTDSTSTTSASAVSGTKSADLFSAIDTSGDGKISEDEFDNFSNLLMQQLQAYLNTYSAGMSNYSSALYSEYTA
ncbi:MAG: EF-hand domain-containing protein [Candidatus Margulisbacteria bacterium]|nr:EF-hand domain-containing protein [Candidatus Margulisiibacteriota bacterium]